LVVSGLFGLVTLYRLVMGRPDDFYHSLTTHLTLALHFWLPAAEIFIFRHLYGEWMGEKAPGERLTTPLLVGGALSLLIGATTGEGTPHPFDYAPIFDSGWFMGGLACVYGLWLATASLPLYAWPVLRRTGEPLPPGYAGFAAASLAAWITFLDLLLGFATLPDFATGGYAFSIALFGPGHAIQFVRIPLMIALWAHLAQNKKGDHRLFTPMMTITAGLALFTPTLYTLYDPVTQSHQIIWTLLLGMGLGSCAILAGAEILLRHPKQRGVTPLLILCFIAFLVGGWAPGLSARTALSLTAHYHGLLGGVTATYLAILLLRIDPRCMSGVHFASGALLVSFAFARLASLPLPRKTASLENIFTLDPISCSGLIIGALICGYAVIEGIWRLTRKERP